MQFPHHQTLLRPHWKKIEHKQHLVILWVYLQKEEIDQPTFAKCVQKNSFSSLGIPCGWVLKIQSQSLLRLVQNE